MVSSIEMGSRKTPDARSCRLRQATLLRGSLLLAIAAAFIVTIVLLQMAFNDYTSHEILSSRKQSYENKPTRSIATRNQYSFPSSNVETNNNNEQKYSADPTYKVAWLMSFPNSGTSFTSKMVRHLSLTSTASNYGKERVDENGEPTPLFATSGNCTNGPFWVDLRSEGIQYSRPKTFVLTKTHCGGRCADCGPNKYVETAESFLVACLSDGNNMRLGTKSLNGEGSPYNKELVQRAVHLVRNPFDNVVSRFHLQLKKYKRGYDDVAEGLSSSRGFFRKYCRKHNKAYEHESATSQLVNPIAFELMRNVPCREDFFKFAQWHNLAFVTTDQLGIPALVVHYEEYGMHYNRTASNLLSFLDLEPKGELIEFVKGKEHIEHFTHEERGRVAKAMKLLSTPTTWDQISRYFNNT